MPLYTYKCSKCGHEQEVFVKGSENSPGKCEKCKGDKLERKFGSFSCRGGGSSKGSSSSCNASSCTPT